MTTKTEQLKTNLDATSQTCTFQHLTRKGDEWVVQDSREYCAGALPDPINDHLLAYGIKGFLGDRTSDFRKHGIPAAMEAMDDLWELLKSGQLSRPRTSTGGLDRALVHLVAELKDQSLPWAEAQLKALSKELRDSLAEKYADDLARIRADLSQAGGSSELGDLL